MNNFRALSESRLLIGTGLLLLLLSLLAPVCEASFASQTLHPQQDFDHPHADTTAMALSHTDNTAHQCCTDFGAQEHSVSVVLPSSTIAAPDTGDALVEIVSIERILFTTARIAFSHHFHFNPTGLPRYLITQRLRV